MRAMSPTAGFSHRHVSAANEILAFCASMAANSILLWCIRREKNKTLSGYKRMLYTTCAVEYFCTICMSCSLMEFEFPNGLYVMFINGPLRRLPLNYHYLLCTMYTFAVGIGVLNVPVGFYFRYQLVCRRRMMKPTEIVAVMAFIVAYALFDSLCITYAFVQNQNPMQDYGYLFENNTIWHEADGTISPFIVAESSAIGLKLLLVFGTFIVLADYSAILYFRWAVMRELQRNQPAMSNKTIRMQSSLSRVLLVQAVLPLFTFCIPLNGIFVALATRREIPYLGLVSVSGLAWIPVVSPLSTLLLVPTFRQRIRCILVGKAFSTVSKFETSQQSTNDVKPIYSVA